jgi:hypothetical protein
VFTHFPEACNKVTYEYIRTQRHSDASSPRRATDRASLEPVTVSDDESSGGDKLKLILRSAGYKDVAVTVRPTTKCEAILKEFMRRSGLEAPMSPANRRQKGKGVAGEGPALSVDGERLDPGSEIGRADLEDGDMVDVVGL